MRCARGSLRSNSRLSSGSSSIQTPSPPPLVAITQPSRSRIRAAVRLGSERDRLREQALLVWRTIRRTWRDRAIGERLAGPQGAVEELVARVDLAGLAGERVQQRGLRHREEDLDAGRSLGIPPGRTMAHVSATLRICSEKLSAAYIEEVLEQAPAKAFELGDPVSPKRLDLGVRKYPMWMLDSPEPPEASLAAHLEWLLAFVEAHQDALASLSSAVEVDLFVGVFSDGGPAGFVLDPALLVRLARARIPLGLDLYPPSS